MNKLQPFSRKIAKIFVTIAACVLAFYSLVVELTVHHAENLNSQTRLSVIAPYHLSLFTESTSEQQIQISPINSIYSHYHLLPKHVKVLIEPTWTGMMHHTVDDSELEFSIYATTNSQGRIVYAIEETTNIEWDDYDFLIVEIMLLFFGIILFIISAGFIINMAKRIAAPFSDLANQLHNEQDESLSPIKVDGELSLELNKTLQGANHFRASIKQALEREQSFTRYVSHELRTPMTVIKGSLSLLRRHDDSDVSKQVARIEHAIDDMEQLTQTFLLLARDKDNAQAQCDVSENFIDNIHQNLSKRITSNNVDYQMQLQQPVRLDAEPVLVCSLISNLLLNAINCSINGNVTLMVSQRNISVIDNGVGLNKKSRGYEGFGIGLNVVQDICKKYQWQFSLVNNETQGCTATVTFEPTTEEY